MPDNTLLFPHQLTDAQIQALIEKVGETALRLGVPVSVAIISSFELLVAQLPESNSHSEIDPTVTYAQDKVPIYTDSTIALSHLRQSSIFEAQRRLGVIQNGQLKAPSLRSSSIAQVKAITVNDEGTFSGVSAQDRAVAIAGVAPDMFTNLYGGVPLIIAENNQVYQTGSMGISGGTQIQDVIIGIVGALQSGFTFTDTQLQKLFSGFNTTQTNEARQLINTLTVGADDKQKLLTNLQSSQILG
jgi:uncharacterized protein GlcG (DUF336 family)